ncbi:MAG: hypothetical protein MPW13_05995 [Candidatus Manganitrophus sp.]|nr:hypothetical protein [Candidatus Manganitrophus sp.]
MSSKNKNHAKQKPAAVSRSGSSYMAGISVNNIEQIAAAAGGGRCSSITFGR